MKTFLLSSLRGALSILLAVAGLYLLLFVVAGLLNLTGATDLRGQSSSVSRPAHTTTLGGTEADTLATKH